MNILWQYENIFSNIFSSIHWNCIHYFLRFNKNQLDMFHKDITFENYMIFYPQVIPFLDIIMFL